MRRSMNFLSYGTRYIFRLTRGRGVAKGADDRISNRAVRLSSADGEGRLAPGWIRHAAFLGGVSKSGAALRSGSKRR